MQLVRTDRLEKLRFPVSLDTWGLIGAVVRAELRGHLTLAVPLVQLAASLEQSDDHFSPPHVHRDVKRRPARHVHGLQELRVVHHLPHDGQRAAAAGHVETAGAVRVTGVPMGSCNTMKTDEIIWKKEGERSLSEPFGTRDPEVD